MTAPELKPCPFCGAVDPEWLASHVVCDCGATGPRQDVDREYQADAMRALTDWNRRADLTPVQPAQVRVKPLVWDDGTNNRKYAKSEIGQYSAREFSIDNVRLDLNGKLLAGSFQTIEAAKAAAQADYEARILAALEPQPISKSADLHDPRDEVIKKLVGAVHNCVGMLDQLVAESGRLVEWDAEDPFRMGEWFEPEDLAQIESARAALAAAKAVQHG